MTLPLAESCPQEGIISSKVSKRLLLGRSLSWLKSRCNGV